MMTGRIMNDITSGTMYIDLNRIEFVITNACSGKCKHCSAGEQISAGGSLDAGAAVNAIKRLVERFKIQSVMTFGGEPLLYADIVLSYPQLFMTAAFQSGKFSAYEGAKNIGR